MASLRQKLCKNLEQTLQSFKDNLSFILRNQRHLELSQMQMFKGQERHFNAIRWMISALNKELTTNPEYTINKDDEDWDAIKVDPIFGYDGWVEFP